MSFSFHGLAAPAVFARSGAIRGAQSEVSKRSSSRQTSASRASRICRQRQRARRAELRATTQQHFEEAIRSMPNLNLSGEGSRARYFQLRGVGELEQYDGAPNPSIGFIVDDIDFSGLGSIAHAVRHRARRSAARPARHALRRECARRVRLHALASAAGGRFRPTSRRRPAATERAPSARRSAARQRRARLPRIAAQLPERRLSATTSSSVATTRTAATS